jgi:hypothetical protein
MGQFEERRKTMLKNNYNEIKGALDNTSRDNARASQIDAEGINNRNLGRVLSYLSGKDVLDYQEKSEARLYDLTDYSSSDLEELKEEELE